jgi:hypothetical protein
MDAQVQKRLATGLVLVAVIIALTFALTRCIKAPMEGVVDNGAKFVDRLIQSCEKLFNATPIVTVNERVVVSAPTGIAELDTAKQIIVVDHIYENTWLGSTKTLTLRGTYCVKAGFNLETNFNICIAQDSHQVTGVRVEMPPPQVLSCEMLNHEVVGSDNGWWNKLSPKDQEEAVNAMQKEASREAQKQGLLNAATQEFEKKIRTIPELRKALITFQYSRDSKG